MSEERGEGAVIRQTYWWKACYYLIIDVLISITIREGTVITCDINKHNFYFQINWGGRKRGRRKRNLIHQNLREQKKP